MRASHALTAMSLRFDEPNLIGSAGLVPAAALMDRIGLDGLVRAHVRIEGVANAEVKVGSLLLGMLAGADSIDDMDVLRHGAMERMLSGVRAPSTLGTFFAFIHFWSCPPTRSCRVPRLLPDHHDRTGGASRPELVGGD